ncbi:MAG TPA: TolC family protein [Bryobacteraceae bacterium]|nr:TolC family protein [Bryobacteraceae bacterium]
MGRRWTLGLCTTFLIASAVGQQPAAAPIQPLTEIPVPPRVGLMGRTTMSLAEVIERVLKNDRDLEISRILREEAGYNVTAAKGAYDPVVGLRVDHSKVVTPIASLIGGAPNGQLVQTQWDGIPQINGLIPETGGSYTTTFNNSRQITNSTFATVNPQYPTALRLDLTQPLWRGLRFDENRYRLQVARKNTQLSAEQFRQRVIDVVTQTTQAYWELAYASQAFDVQNEAVRLAVQQYESNRRQAEQGILSPIDVVAAQTQVSTFQQNLFLAQQALTQAENNLKTLILPNRNDLLWDAELAPETPPATETSLPTFSEAVEEALRGRPELAVSMINLEINRLDQRRSEEQTKPRVDAFATLTTSGLAGIPLPPQPNPFTAGFVGITNYVNQLGAISGLPPIPPLSFGSGGIPPALTGSYGQSLSNLWSGSFPTAQIGVQVSLPLRNRTAEAQAAVSAAEGRRLRAVQDQIGMLVEADVRNSMQAVSSAQARLAASVVASRSAQQQYESEQRQLQAGTSTVFLVLQRQTDLINARNREVRSRADMAEAIANFERATAGTIAAHNIQLQP